MTHSFSQRIDRAITAVGTLGLLSPLVVAAVMFIVKSH